MAASTPGTETNEKGRTGQYNCVHGDIKARSHAPKNAFRLVANPNDDIGQARFVFDVNDDRETGDGTTVVHAKADAWTASAGAVSDTGRLQSRLPLAIPGPPYAPAAS